MTDKHSFLERLKSALATRGISETDAEPYLAQFDRYYERMANDDLATAETLLDIESIADNISTQVAERYEQIENLTAQTMNVPAVDIDNEPTTEAQIPAVKDDVGGYEELDFSDDVVDYSEDIVEYEEYAAEVPLDVADEGSTRLPDYVEEENIPGTKMFWGLFVLSFPVTLPLALVMLGAFGVLWGAIAAVMAGAVVALIATVCLGSVLSLVGIIYGIVQMGTAVPIGLYEIGIGVIIAGITMLVGILIYNFAVRAVPVLFKLVWRLFKYVLKRLKGLFNYLKKESAKL